MHIRHSAFDTAVALPRIGTRESRDALIRIFKDDLAAAGAPRQRPSVIPFPPLRPQEDHASASATLRDLGAVARERRLRAVESLRRAS